MDKILPTSQKPLWLNIKDESEIIFRNYLKNIKGVVSIEIDSSDKEYDSNCYIKIYTDILDEYDSRINYIFSIKCKDEMLSFKPISYNGLNSDEFKSFKQLIYPLHDKDDVPEILDLFASKVTPFIRNMIKTDDYR